MFGSLDQASKLNGKHPTSSDSGTCATTALFFPAITQPSPERAYPNSVLRECVTSTLDLELTMKSR